MVVHRLGREDLSLRGRSGTLHGTTIPCVNRRAGLPDPTETEVHTKDTGNTETKGTDHGPHGVGDRDSLSFGPFLLSILGALTGTGLIYRDLESWFQKVLLLKNHQLLLDS